MHTSADMCRPRTRVTPPPPGWSIPRADGGRQFSLRQSDDQVLQSHAAGLEGLIAVGQAPGRAHARGVGSLKSVGAGLLVELH